MIDRISSGGGPTAVPPPPPPNQWNTKIDKWEAQLANWKNENSNDPNVQELYKVVLSQLEGARVFKDQDQLIDNVNNFVSKSGVSSEQIDSLYNQFNFMDGLLGPPPK
jgi:hypothetical protein